MNGEQLSQAVGTDDTDEGCARRKGQSVPVSNCEVLFRKCKVLEETVTIGFNADGGFWGIHVGGSLEFPIPIPRGCDTPTKYVEACPLVQSIWIDTSVEGSVKKTRQKPCGTHVEKPCKETAINVFTIPSSDIPQWVKDHTDFPGGDIELNVPGLKECIPDNEHAQNPHCDGRDIDDDHSTGTVYTVIDETCFSGGDTGVGGGTGAD